MSKNTIIKGTFILTIAGIITKILGFYNRIFLTRLIGVKELGIYQLIFPIYLLTYSFCSQGIATTLTKHVSYHIGKKNGQNVKKTFYISLIMSGIISLITCLVIYNTAYPISRYILKNTDCAVLLKIISIAIPFVSVKACINAYFVGVNKPGLHGFSHLFEQIIRISTAYILAYLWTDDKINAVLAVIAVVVGEIAATILAIFFYEIYKKKNNVSFMSENVSGKTNLSLIKELGTDIAPITLNNLVFTLFSSFEAIIMPTMLYYYYSDSNLAMEMYGIVTGIVIPFLLFPSTITTSLSMMLLPAVSYANAKNDNKKIRSAIINSVLFCLMLGVAAWLIFLLSGKWACEIAFNNIKAGMLLRKMSYLCPLIYLSGTLSAIMNGIDKAFKNLIFNISGITMRIIISFTLVPKYGITAYISGMTISYFIIDILLLTSCLSIKKEFSYISR